MPVSAHLLRRCLATTGAALLLATGAACGAAEKPSSESSSDGSNAALTYAACMRDNGVQVQDPKPGEGPRIPEGVAQSAVDKAEQTCGKNPSSDGQATSAEGLQLDAEYEALRLKADKCMRDAGYVPPKPEQGEGGKSMQTTPEFEAAREACKTELAAVDKKFKELMEQGAAQ